MADINCDYINNEWDCQSPKLSGNETKCISSNYKNCIFYPQLELRAKVPFAKENNLEKEAKE